MKPEIALNLSLANIPVTMSLIRYPSCLNEQNIYAVCKSMLFSHIGVFKSCLGPLCHLRYIFNYTLKLLIFCQKVSPDKIFNGCLTSG